MSSVKTVAVVGTGVIGAAWTTLFLSKGLRVIASDPMSGAEAKLRAFLSRELYLEEEDAQKRLIFTDRLEDHLKDVDWVQENGPEKLNYKEQIFDLLDRKTPRHAVLASSSSGLPASKYLKKCESHGERILVGHPFNPPHIIPLVEVVPHSATSRDTIDLALRFYKLLGKVPIEVNQETPGFVANRLQSALVNEAYSLVSRGIVSASDLDLAVTNSIALRWAYQGPFITKVLGGGGGRSGFQRHLEHIGLASREWTADMVAHPYEADEKTNSKLMKAVQEQLQIYSDAELAELPHLRNRFLQKVLKVKEEIISDTLG